MYTGSSVPLLRIVRAYVLVRGRERLTVALYMAAEESPPTHRARSHTQVWVARVTAMAQKRHGLFPVMMRLSP